MIEAAVFRYNSEMCVRDDTLYMYTGPIHHGSDSFSGENRFVVTVKVGDANAASLPDTRGHCMVLWAL